METKTLEKTCDIVVVGADMQAVKHHLPVHVWGWIQ